MKILHCTAFTLLLVGGVNWLLVGAFEWDLGAIFGGQDALLSKIIYVLVGLAAIFEIVAHKKNCKMCGTGAVSAIPPKV